MDKDARVLLKNMHVYAEDRYIETGYILIENGRIIEVGDMREFVSLHAYQHSFEVEGGTVIPGLIDTHIHGVAGADVMDATFEALDVMASSLPAEGTTGFLATTITQDSHTIEKALINVRDYMATATPGKAEILGIHLEGPFINKNKAGAQPLNYIIDPDLQLFQKWQTLANDLIKLVTLAPERPGGLDFVQHLQETGVIAAIGHSDATYPEVERAIAAGLTRVTHLFNQMRGLHHREPGVVGAAFLKDELMVELIADGVHVVPEMLQLALKQKPIDKLMLITDSMRAKCLNNGTYDLGGQKVTVENNQALLADGTLAGSVLKMGQAVKNMLVFTGCSLREAVEMAAVNPAKQLNIFDKKGSIKVGKDADLVVLNEQNDIVMTLCKGTVAFCERGEISAD